MNHLLLIGKERFLKDEALADLEARLFRDPSEASINFQSFHADRDPVSSVLDFLGTAPFLAAKRLAVFWGVEGLKDEDQERLLAGLDRLPSSAHLVLETEQTNTKKDAFVKKLAEKAAVAPCHVPFDKDLPAWVENRARKKGLTLERGLSQFLIERVGKDLGALSGALEELLLYVHPRRSASRADAASLIQNSPEESVFQLADHLMDGKKKEALRVVDSLYRAGSRGPEIVAALAGQIERYKKGALSLSMGRPLVELGEEMRVPPMHRPAFFSRLQKISVGRLARMQKALLACDESFKTGQAGERLSIERFILTL